MAFRTGNPALGATTFDGFSLPDTLEQRMTLQGTVNKSFLMLGVLLLCAAWPWSQYFAGNAQLAMGAAMLGLIAGLVVAMIIFFKAIWAPYLALPYAGLEGLALGGISASFEANFPGIVIQAVGLTFATLGALLFAYTSRLIKPTENFKLGVAAATGGIFLVYLVSLGLSFFGMSVPFLHDSGPIGIGISLFIVVIAALNLVLDFDFIETGVERGAPRHMEWYAAFGLMVTLVWLYLEILRLLAKTRR